MCVGLSGGMDSVVLLHALSRMQQSNDFSIRLSAIHVHHGISPHADTWADFCTDFCSRCGVHPFASASFEPMGGDFYAVNIACLDDVAPGELATVPIIYEDGRNDAWDRPPTMTAYL